MKATIALAFVLAINMLFFLSQTAINNINPDTDVKFFEYGGSLISKFDTGGYVLNESVINELPTSEGTVIQESGNVFTDTWNAIKNWFLDSTGVNYLLSIVNAMPNFLKVVGLPQELVFAIGFFWHAMTVFLIIMMFKGGY